MQQEFDRTAFRMGKLEDNDNDNAFWMAKTKKERLEAAYFLISKGYQFDPENPPEMDKTAFRALKRKP